MLKPTNYKTTQMSNNQCRKNVQNSHAAQTITKAPNQSVKDTIFSAPKDFDSPREI